MSWLVDTSVWSLALRRDGSVTVEEVTALREALLDAHPVLTTGIVVQEIRNACRRRGVQIGTIDALLIQLCRRHDLVLLSADGDCRSARAHVAFRLWSAV